VTESVWLARSDSLTLVEVNLAGDTIRRIQTDHRGAEFTAAQLEAVRRANRELGYDGGFVPIIVQALHALNDGRVLVQIGGDMATPGRELDMFSAEGRFLGTVHTPFPLHHRSVLGSRGDTLYVHALGAFEIPLVVKAVIVPR
jgi:hypothetical protein